jgi:SNF2 family DNA or RNA helicase
LKIGQTKQVIIYRLIAKGTIEEKVMALKARKNKLFKGLFDQDATFSSAITPDDIRALFD